MKKTEQIETPTHHNVEVDDALETFRKHFRYYRVFVHDGYMTYKILRLEQARSIQHEANKLIADLKLPLKTELNKSPYDAVLTIEPND